MNMPAGSLIPNVTMVKAPLTNIATKIARITDIACSGGFSTQSPKWVFGLPGLHSANKLYTSSVLPMRVYGFRKQRNVVTSVTW